LDRFEVGSGIRDVLLFDPVHKGLQDLQDLIPIAPTAEQGNGKVAGHGAFVSVWFGGRLSGRARSHGSGSDQQVILPTGTEQQVSDLIHRLAVLICLQDGSAALSGDLIDAHGTVGGGVVAHGSFALVDLISIGCQDGSGSFGGQLCHWHMEQAEVLLNLREVDPCPIDKVGHLPEVVFVRGGQVAAGVFGHASVTIGDAVSDEVGPHGGRLN